MKKRVLCVLLAVLMLGGFVVPAMAMPATAQEAGYIEIVPFQNVRGTRTANVSWSGGAVVSGYRVDFTYNGNTGVFVQRHSYAFTPWTFHRTYNSWTRQRTTGQGQNAARTNVTFNLAVDLRVQANNTWVGRTSSATFATPRL